MTDPNTAMYFFVIVGVVIMLGIAMAYGVVRNRERTRAEKLEAERGAGRVHEQEDREDSRR